MDAAELMRAVRRRWIIVAATVLAALVAGWLTTKIVPADEPARTYEATSVILSDEPTTFGYTGAYNLRTIAALATVGEVPKRVAGKVGFERDPLELTERVRSSGNTETGILRITATSTDAEEARVLADAFAAELVTFINERLGITSARQADSLRSRTLKLENEIENLDRQIGSDTSGDEVLLAQRNAKVTQYTALVQQLQQITTQNAGGQGLTIIQDAVPVPLSTAGLLQVRSWPSRLMLAGLLGLLAGVALVLLRERLDTRIRSKDVAEQRFDLPVLAEIPFVRQWRRRPGIAVVSHPKSTASDAFRLLAAGVTRRPPTPPQVILVSGPGPGEGKSTVVANLAAAFGEVGKKVLVLSCDLHRPTIHSMFGVPNTQGLTDALRSGRDGHAIINGHRWRTAIENVRLVPSGLVPEKPGELLASPLMRQVIGEAREVADIVLIDSAPILAASDATHLFPLVDAVLVVGRAGQTTAEAAQRTTELLLRLGAPVIGVALNGATEHVLRRGYSEYYYRGTDGRRQRRSVASLVRRRD
jgi:capsular exopolysaccharide synthesis family protein